MLEEYMTANMRLWIITKSVGKANSRVNMTQGFDILINHDPQHERNNPHQNTIDLL